MSLLHIDKMRKDYGGLKALSDVSFNVEQGEIVSIIGPNGAGKTTLFDCLTGYTPKTSGRVFFEGKDVSSYPPHALNKAGMARTFQQIRLFPNLTLMETLKVGMHSHTRGGIWAGIFRPSWYRKQEEECYQKGLSILSLFQERLLPRIDQKVMELSYANRRRTEIARALASEPKLLLLDEPAAGMNPHETQLATDLIRDLRKRGNTILFIEHDMSMVMSVSDRVIVLDHGVKIAEGNPSEIQKNADVLEAYMGRRGYAET
ncbi:MAG: ABC transporter ATP-binding protein [Spirochaetales bacterium]|jgi:ABC-type branched-subunit amino acid transport system ATPase component|nr:ABC transporter ATP-binding protein [Spirochaetales bacterium]